MFFNLFGTGRNYEPRDFSDDDFVDSGEPCDPMGSALVADGFEPETVEQELAAEGLLDITTGNVNIEPDPILSEFNAFADKVSASTGVSTQDAETEYRKAIDDIGFTTISSGSDSEE